MVYLLLIYCTAMVFPTTQKPFLKGVSSLSEDVRSVLSAAYSLDHDLTELYISAKEDNRLRHHLNRDLDHYPVR
jgi:hypothetical protein